MAALGLRLVGIGKAAVPGGTFRQHLVNTSVGLVNETARLRMNSAAMPQINQAEAISFFVGLTARWFRDAFCREVVRTTTKQGRDARERMAEAAKQVPGAALGIIPVSSGAMDCGATGTTPRCRS